MIVEGPLTFEPLPRVRFGHIMSERGQTHMEREVLLGGVIESAEQMFPNSIGVRLVLFHSYTLFKLWRNEIQESEAASQFQGKGWRIRHNNFCKLITHALAGDVF